MTDPYADFRDDDSPDKKSLDRLKILARQQSGAETAVAEAEAALKKAQEKERDYKERLIPEVMEELGMEEFTTSDGFHIKIEKKIRTSLSKENKPAGFAWLEKNGHGGLIKRQIGVAFNRDQQEAATKLLATLRKDYDVKQEMKVESSTLKAFVIAQLKAGTDLPLGVFGVHEQKFAKLSIKSPVS